MAQLTITIPNSGDVAQVLLVAATEYAAAEKIDINAMSSVQIVERYVKEWLRSVYVSRKSQTARVTKDSELVTEIAAVKATATTNIT